MEIGECSVADEDGKPAALAQHLMATTTAVDGATVEESGIVRIHTFTFLF